MGRLLPVVLLCAACSKGEREIPQWQDGYLVTGDCSDEYVGTDTRSATQLVLDVNPLIATDVQANPLGAVVKDDQSYYDLMVGLNFSSWLTVDFSVRQVAAVWINQPGSCGLTADEWHFRERADGSFVFEGTFTDSSLNCAEQCPGTQNKGLIMASIEKDLDLDLCRVVVPGCQE